MSDGADVLVRVDANVQSLMSKLQEAMGGFGSLFESIAGGVAGGNLLAQAIMGAATAALDFAKTAVTALPDLAFQVADLGDRYLVMSKQMGVSTETLSAWDYAAEQAGSSLETMTSTMFRLQMKLGQGGEETAASIKKLGLNLDELAGGDPGEAFMQILDSLGKIPDQSERTAAGFELFGRQWKSISQLATEDMRGLMEEAGQLGLVMSDEAAKMGDDLGDMWTKLEKTWEGVTRRLGTALMPSMLEAITSFQETFQNALEATGVAALDWQEILTPVAEVIGTLVAGAAKLAAVLTGTIVGAISNVSTQMDRLKSFAGEVWAPFATAIDRVTASSEKWMPTLQAIAIGLYELSKHMLASLGPLASTLWETFGVWMDMWASRITVVMEFFGPLVQAVWDFLEPLASPIWDAAIGIVQLLATVFQSVMKIVSVLVNALGWLNEKLGISEKLSELLSLALWPVKKALEGVLWVIGKVVEGLTWLFQKFNEFLDWMNVFDDEGGVPAAPKVAHDLDIVSGSFDRVATMEEAVALASRETNLELGILAGDGLTKATRGNKEAEKAALEHAKAVRELADALRGKKMWEDFKLQLEAMSAASLTFLQLTEGEQKKLVEQLEALKLKWEGMGLSAEKELAKLPPKLKAIADAAAQVSLQKQITEFIKFSEATQTSLDGVMAASVKTSIALGALDDPNFLKGLNSNVLKAVAGLDTLGAKLKAFAATWQRAEEGNRRLQIDSLTGSDKRLAALQLEHDARMSALDAEMAAMPALTDQITRLKEQEDARYNAAIENENRYTGDVLKDMEMRGYASQKELTLRVAVERKVLEEMEKSGAANKAQIEAQKKVVEDAAAAAAGTTKSTWSGTLDALSAAFEQLANIAGDTFSGMARGVATVLSSLKTVGESVQGMKDGFAEMTGGGGLMSMLGGLGQMAGAFGAALSAAMQIGKVIVGLFKKEGFKDVMARVGREWGVEISENLAKAIDATAKEKFGNSRAAAEIFHLGDILSEAGGLTDENVATFTKKMRDVFVMVETGKFTVKQARQVLDENFAQFADHMVASGELASKEFLELLELNQRFGTESKQITDFVKNQTGRLGTNLATMVVGAASDWDLEGLVSAREKIAALTAEIASTKDEEQLKKLNVALKEQTQLLEETKAKSTGAGVELDRMGRLAVASFNAAIKNGVSYLDALDQVGPALDTLTAAYSTLELQAGPALQELLGFRQKIADNRPLVEAAAATNEVMLALSAVGGLTVETLADIEAQGVDTFNKMTEAGFTEGEALVQMKGWLENVRKAHADLGTPIDENTQRLIDQAEAQGILAEEGLSTNDILMEGLGALIEALGGDVPDAFKTMSRAARESATDVTAAMAKPASAVDTIGDKLEGVDWEGWAEAAVDAAISVQDEVDAISFGHSPGGLKEIPLKLAEALRATSSFSSKMIKDMTSVADAVDETFLDRSLQMTASAPSVMSSQVSMPSVETTEQMRQTEAMTALQESLADFAAAPPPVEFTANIETFDAGGLLSSVERKLLPVFLEALAANRGGVVDAATDRAGNALMPNFYCIPPASNIVSFATWTCSQAMVAGYQLSWLTDGRPERPARANASNAWFIASFPSAFRVDVLGVIAPTLASGVGLRIQASTLSDFSVLAMDVTVYDVAGWQDGAALGAQMSYRNRWVDLTAQAGYSTGGFRYWRIGCTANTLATFSIADIWMSGQKIGFAYGPQWGGTRAQRRSSVTHETPQGVRLRYDRGALWREFDFTFVLPQDNGGIAFLQNWWMNCQGSVRASLIVPDDTDRECYVVVFKEGRLPWTRKTVGMFSAGFAMSELPTAVMVV